MLEIEWNVIIILGHKVKKHFFVEYPEYVYNLITLYLNFIVKREFTLFKSSYRGRIN